MASGKYIKNTSKIMYLFHAQYRYILERDYLLIQ